MSSSDDEAAPQSRASVVAVLFDDDDSFSDHSSASGPRRRCSIVSSNSDRPNIMDLRYPESVDGGKSYDLSVCSDLDSVHYDDALEKMGMFEIALSNNLKKDHKGAIKRANTYPDIAKPSTKGGLLHSIRRYSMKGESQDHGGILRHSSFVLPTSDDDSSVVKKSKTSRRKLYIRRCAQAAAVLVCLSGLVASVIFFEESDSDPSSLITGFSTTVSSVLENLFGSLSGQEEEETERDDLELGEKRVMTEQLSEMMIPHDPPVMDINHDHDHFFIQTFRNHQKLSQRINKDPMRQRMMVQGENRDMMTEKTDVRHYYLDQVAPVRIQQFRDNQRLALRGGG